MLSQTIKITILSLSLALSALSLTSQAVAAQLPNGKAFEYVANKESLRDLLKNYAATQGLPIIVSDKVSATVNGAFSGNNVRKFLDDICQVFGLIWYYDGSVLYIYNAAEVETKVVEVSGVNLNRLKSSIRSMGVYDNRYNWKYVPGQKMIYVSGPPRFVQLVAEVAQIQSKETMRVRQQTTNVQIFRLRYALAHDRSYNSRGKTVVVKGLATVLKEILGGEDRRGQVVANNVTQGEDGEKIAKASELATRLAEGETRLDGRISADRRLNAIVINDSPEKMPMYKALIDTLDVPSEQVEISVSIMDVSTDRLAELGFDWRNEGSDGSIQFGSPGTDANPRGAAAGPYGVQTIVAAKAGQFLTKIKALSEDGNAQIFSRPVVLTKDMVEAVIDNSNTFYVRIAGKEDVELFPITYGTLMRVTPRIVDEDDARWIHMDINIEDGHKSAEAEVDAIPQVKKTFINTQSMIPNGDSLLIGGYIYKSNTEQSGGVPILEDIPLLGYFFSWDKEESRQWVRLFMISPRTVTRGDMLRSNQKNLRGIYHQRGIEKRFLPETGGHNPNMTSYNTKAKGKAAGKVGKRQVTKKSRSAAAKNRSAQARHKANPRGKSQTEVVKYGNDD